MYNSTHSIQGTALQKAFRELEDGIKNIKRQKLTNAADVYFQMSKLAAYTPNIQFLFYLMLAGARFGTAGKNGLNEKEKEFIEKFFSKYYKGELQDLYPLVAVGIDEQTVKLVEAVLEAAKDRFGIPFLKFILCFAYCDGVLEDSLAERLESLFEESLRFRYLDPEAGKLEDELFKLISEK